MIVSELTATAPLTDTVSTCTEVTSSTEVMSSGMPKASMSHPFEGSMPMGWSDTRPQGWENFPASPEVLSAAFRQLGDELEASRSFVSACVTKLSEQLTATPQTDGSPVAPSGETPSNPVMAGMSSLEMPTAPLNPMRAETTMPAGATEEVVSQPIITTQPTDEMTPDALVVPVQQNGEVFVVNPSRVDDQPVRGSQVTLGGLNTDLKPAETPSIDLPIVSKEVVVEQKPMAPLNVRPMEEGEVYPVREPGAPLSGIVAEGQPTIRPTTSSMASVDQSMVLPTTSPEVPKDQSMGSPQVEARPSQSSPSSVSSAPSNGQSVVERDGEFRGDIPRTTESMPKDDVVEVAVPREMPTVVVPMQTVEVPVTPVVVETVTTVAPELAAQRIETMRSVAEVVVSTMTVSSELAKTGSGEIQIQLKKEILDGSTVRLEARGEDLKIVITPATREAAAVLESHLESFRTHLSERVANWRINVGVTAWDPKAKNGKLERDE